MDIQRHVHYRGVYTFVGGDAKSRPRLRTHNTIDGYQTVRTLECNHSIMRHLAKHTIGLDMEQPLKQRHIVAFTTLH